MSGRTDGERPCIHVTLLPDADPALFRWVEIGAEEEGVPCRRTNESGSTVMAAAYAAAQSSRFNVGVAISAGAVALHEVHMTSSKPVLICPFEQGDARLLCRLMGCNAARMIIRKPFRFVEDEIVTDEKPPAPHSRRSAPPKPEPESDLDRNQLKVVVRAVIKQLSDRGLR